MSERSGNLSCRFLRLQVPHQFVSVITLSSTASTTTSSAQAMRISLRLPLGNGTAQHKIRPTPLYVFTWTSLLFSVLILVASILDLGLWMNMSAAAASIVYHVAVISLLFFSRLHSVLLVGVSDSRAAIATKRPYVVLYVRRPSQSDAINSQGDVRATMASSPMLPSRVHVVPAMGHSGSREIKTGGPCIRSTFRARIASASSKKLVHIPQPRTPSPQLIAQAGEIGHGVGRGRGGLVPVRGVRAAVFERESHSSERECRVWGRSGWEARVCAGKCMTAYLGRESAALLRVGHERQLQLGETRKQHEQRAELRLPSGSSAEVAKRAASDVIFGSACTPCSSATRFRNGNPASSAMRVRVLIRAGVGLEHREDRRGLRGGEAPEDAAVVAREGAHAGEGGEDGERAARDPEIVHVVVVAGDETRDAQAGGGAGRYLLAGRDCASRGLDAGKAGQYTQVGHADLRESNPVSVESLKCDEFGEAREECIHQDVQHRLGVCLCGSLSLPSVVVQPGGARAHVGCDPGRGVEIQARQGIVELCLQRLQLVRIRVEFEFGEAKRAREGAQGALGRGETAFVWEFGGRVMGSGERMGIGVWMKARGKRRNYSKLLELYKPKAYDKMVRRNLDPDILSLSQPVHLMDIPNKVSMLCGCPYCLECCIQKFLSPEPIDSW
ncbi:hypothetical protein K438DRAFT_2086768 [Mycena galopus ATCC 62051]|nr:hypothetical protein K438DRAFT_2086768 [Mycena galopus ATCC 62051]